MKQCDNQTPHALRWSWRNNEPYGIEVYGQVAVRGRVGCLDLSRYEDVETAIKELAFDLRDYIAKEMNCHTSRINFINGNECSQKPSLENRK